MFVAIDRTSKLAFAKLVSKAGKLAAATFLREVVEALPYRLHTVLTYNGVQFGNRKWDKFDFSHAFGLACAGHRVELRLTTVNHPLTNGQVERMNWTIKEAAVKRYHYGSQHLLRTHLADFVAAYNHARRLKILRGRTPYEYVVKCWTGTGPVQSQSTPPNHIHS